jgi:two-component system, LytTR family, sensor kinase
MTISHKYSPYIFIAILCLVIAFFRVYILIEFPWYFHVFGIFLQFMVMSAIWQLVGFINRKLEKRFTFEKQPGIQILLQVLVTILMLSPVFILSYILAKPYLPSFVNNKLMALISVLVITVLMLMTFGYYTYELFVKNKAAAEEKNRLQLEAAQLEKEKSLMQYHHLRNQVNPHFLFNTFTSLDGLVQTDPQLASEFIRHLSKVYRYVLEHKENEVVSLQTELNFIEHYISLLKIRYKEAICFSVDISDEAMEKGIVMITLQMLIDNAIKHNMLHPDAPLKIRIWDENGYFRISNNRQTKKQIETSNGQGLPQLKQLYSYLSSDPVVIVDDKDYFEVQLPLL